MPSEAAAIKLKPGTDYGAEFYRTRDDFFRAYNPVTEEERLLVTQIARAWVQLQEAFEFRADLTARLSLADLFENDFDRYKALNRAVSDAERMWRQAVVMFERARRRRETRKIDVTRHHSAGAAASNRPAVAAGSTLVPGASAPHSVPLESHPEIPILAPGNNSRAAPAYPPPLSAAPQ
jgi:hypothetical protein